MEIGPLASLAVILTLVTITLGASLWVPHSSR
jgi:hypothetical protein